MCPNFGTPKNKKMSYAVHKSYKQSTKVNEFLSEYIKGFVRINMVK